MNAEIVLEVVMDLSIFNQNWWMEQFAAQQPKIVGRIC